MSPELAQFGALRPAGGFDLIMADPPWRFDNWSAAGEAKNAKAQYDCTPLEWIAALPVSALAARDCLLWLWATNPMLPQALAVLAAWGFDFKTAGTWVKRTRHGKIGFGTGYVFRSANEPILIGSRGSPATERHVRSAIITGATGLDGDEVWPCDTITIEARTRAHSQKPDEAYLACEALIPGARKIELFSRTNRAGWVAWGDEVGKLGDVA